MIQIRNIRIDPIGLWLFKWVVLPLLILWFCVVLIDLEVMKYKGRKMCKEHGYIEFKYIPPNRIGYGEKYIFTHKINSDGSIDESARLEINLD